MKKALVFSVMLLTSVVFIPSTARASEAATSVEAGQIRVQIGNRRNRRYRRYENRRYNNRRVRTTTTTRIVGWGRNRYRETVRITYLPNGRTTTQVIRRQRIRY